jgi:hypothetical protein
MLRKLAVISFFIVVFGLPVGWYLTLQIFGENKFDLPVLEQLDAACVLNSGGYLLIDSLDFLNNKNEWRRISKKIKHVNHDELEIISTAGCMFEKPVVLVDQKGQLRGAYDVSREETDRLLTEIDIYILNLKELRSEQK